MEQGNQGGLQWRWETWTPDSMWAFLAQRSSLSSCVWKDQPSLASRTYNNLTWEPQEQASLPEHPFLSLLAHLGAPLNPQEPSFSGDRSKRKMGSKSGLQASHSDRGGLTALEDSVANRSAVWPLWANLRGLEHAFFFPSEQQLLTPYWVGPGGLIKGHYRTVPPKFPSPSHVVSAFLTDTVIVLRTCLQRNVEANCRERGDICSTYIRKRTPLQNQYERDRLPNRKVDKNRYCKVRLPQMVFRHRKMWFTSLIIRYTN